MRILGLDFGGHTCGVAVSDALGLTAQGVEIIRREKPTKLRQTLARVQALCEEYQVEQIVVGLPLHMNGDMSDSAEKASAFAEQVKARCKVPVIMRDERLTTVEAYETMQELGIKGRDRKKYVDEIAAVFILQGYLDELYDNRRINNEEEHDRI